MKQFIKSLGEGPFGESDQGAIQRVVFVSTFALLSKLVASDGDMSSKELLLVEQLMTETMKLDAAKRKYATKVFNEARKSLLPIADFVMAYKAVLQDRPKMYEWLLDILVRVSLADEVIVPEEIKILEEVCEGLGFDEHKLEEIKSRYVSIVKDDSAYRKLGAGDKDNFQKIQEIYNIKMREFDVARLISEGFSNELVEIAMKRQAEFTSAFMQVKKDKGV